ncbi:IucA/IucC family protein [Streptomyces sp. NPDC059590]|uniref:IucA/IucC family protein n=1 Tax=Streptomyces sp. NPDC059590 TaxID=3346877 RepID=UPI0036908DC9
MIRADEAAADTTDTMDTTDTTDAFEAELLARVLDTLLREDAYGLRSRAQAVRRADGDWLRVVLTDGGGVLLPVEPDGFQCEIRVRRPAHLLVEEAPGGGAAPVPHGGGPLSTDDAGGAAPRAAAGPAPRPDAPSAARPGAGNGASPGAQPAVAPPPAAEAASYSPPGGAALTTLDAVLNRLRHAADPDDRGRYDTFVVECRRTLDAMRLHARVRPGVVERLAAAYGDRPAEQWAGVHGSLAYDTLAAFRDHPVYPTGRTRLALSDAEQRAHAPEFHPSFRLRWAALPREAVTGDAAGLPAWWPRPGALGLPSGLDESHLAFPVHPLSAPRMLAIALRATGLTDRAHLADAPCLDVRPTLSMRTVAVTDDPLTHLKLPLATATLGARNRRTIKPGTLADGAAGQRLTEAVLALEPRVSGGVLLADEGTYLHAGHEFLATLVRRYPPGLDGCQVVPLAALLAPAPGTGTGGGLVVDALAARYYGGDLLALLDAYLTLLFDVHTTLFAYGLALESHQQNTSLVLDEAHGRPRLRLLLKDHDGPRVHPARLADALGDGDDAARLLSGFDDDRITTDGDGPVADVFATITVHLCAGALAFELARLGRAPLDALLRLIRDRLAEAVDRLGEQGPGAPGAVLRALVLDADRLPVKAMVTAGSLFTKQRSGAADINKHYVTGPNYLLPGLPGIPARGR